VNLEDYRMAFTSTILILILIAASPTVALLLPASGERFSEFWVLGPGHMVEDYPFNVREGRQYRVYVGVSNHLGSSAFYMVYVKFRNQTQLPPNATSAQPSEQPFIREFRVFAANDETWETLVTFSISQATFLNRTVLVNRIAVNGVGFPVDYRTRWNSQDKGFYFQLFFELWLYDLDLERFSFHNRFVGIWLNVTR